ncbi:MAG: hypothetical protein AB8F65_04320 [Woeseiaceae bacterium]
MASDHSDLADCHGKIVCGAISVTDLDRSIALYTEFLKHEVVDKGQIDNTLAQLWGAPEMVGARFALLQPTSGFRCYLRLIEVPSTPGFKPAQTYGWSAYEICVADVFELAKQLADSDFKIVGPPKLVDGFSSFIPMQVYGPDGEILFLNQVNHSDDDADLPIAQSEVDHIFIAVLGTRDRESCVSDLARDLALDRAGTHHFRYSLINRAFALPAETQHTITMVQHGRTPCLQVDQLPDAAQARPQHSGWLPPGNSMLTLVVDSLDALPIDAQAVSPPIPVNGPLYEGRQVVTIRCGDSALLELVALN